ncbi:MAG: restriction endonuclease, partial [Stellaceae bacterium]
HVGPKMPKKGRGKSGELDPLSLPNELQTALEALYGHYAKTFALWEQEGVDVPPVFIVVCNNTSTSKLVYDFISGFIRESDGVWVQGRFELFRNYDQYGERFPRPRTLLIDSEQLESGDALDKDFRTMAADEIERFRRDLVQRTGDHHAGEKISAQDLLREVMNTVGKPGRLGESIRCVVSVSMLTEGWDANTVTHILGVRAFGTQLLCEQVVGRALRRQSYDLNEENLLPPEYADVLGIPFDFTAKPVVAPPTKPRKTLRVEAVQPDRDALEIRFPRVEGYRIELPEERLTAKFTADSVLELDPKLVGPSITRNQGIIGEGVELTLKHLADMRPSTIVYHLAARLLFTKFRDVGEDPKMYLFGELRRVVRQWLDGGYLRCTGGTYPAQLIYQDLADRACERIKAAITESMAGEHPIKAVLDPYNPAGSTAHVRFDTSKTTLWQTDHRLGHINYVVCDSDWEAEFCRAAEANPRVRAYVKNQGLGFEVPYLLGATPKKYLPDFIVRVDDGHGDEDLLNLVVEIKGYRGEDAKDKANTMDAYWVPGVNNLGTFGRWAFAEFKESVYAIAANFDALIERAVASRAE